MDGIPRTLPSLGYAAKVLNRAARVGVAVEPEPSIDPDTIGDLLLGIVAAARAAGVDAELALRAAADVVADQARGVEARP
jgi:XTP/dITP diphosphohydrolase